MDIMAITVTVPKDLNNIRTKVAFNLTKRQIICFGLAFAIGVPVYFLVKDVAGVQVASLLMVGLMLPFFILSEYKKDGFPAEKRVYFMVRQKFLTPGIRPYKSQNVYKQLQRYEKMRREVEMLEAKEREAEKNAKRNNKTKSKTSRKTSR